MGKTNTKTLRQDSACCVETSRRLTRREQNKQGEKVKWVRQTRGQTIKALIAGIENLNFTLCALKNTGEI